VGDSVTLSPQAADSGSYYWSGPAGFSSGSREVSINNIKLTMSGNYIVTFINRKLCYSTYILGVAVKKPVDIIIPKLPSSSSIYPNPSDGGKFKIVINNFSDKSQLRIYDMQGKLVYGKLLYKNENDINARLSKGIYIIEITNGHDQIKQKLVVN